MTFSKPAFHGFELPCKHPLKYFPDAVDGGDPGDGEEGAAGQGEEAGAVREAGEGPVPEGEGSQGGCAPGKYSRFTRLVAKEGCQNKEDKYTTDRL